MSGRPDSGVDRCGPGGQKNYVTNFAFTRIHGAPLHGQGIALKYLPRYLGNRPRDCEKFHLGRESVSYINFRRGKLGVERARSIENHATNRREKIATNKQKVGLDSRFPRFNVRFAVDYRDNL